MNYNNSNKIHNENIKSFNKSIKHLEGIITKLGISSWGAKQYAIDLIRTNKQEMAGRTLSDL